MVADSEFLTFQSSCWGRESWLPYLLRFYVHVEVSFLCLFLVVPWVGLKSVLLSCHTHLQSFFFFSFFFFFFQGVCILISLCRSSTEPSHWDSSFECPPHMFRLRNKKNDFQLRILTYMTGSVFFFHCKVFLFDFILYVPVRGILAIFLLSRLGPSIFCLPPKISKVSGIPPK